MHSPPAIVSSDCFPKIYTLRTDPACTIHSAPRRTTHDIDRVQSHTSWDRNWQTSNHCPYFKFHCVFLQFRRGHYQPKVPRCGPCQPPPPAACWWHQPICSYTWLHSGAWPAPPARSPRGWGTVSDCRMTPPWIFSKSGLFLSCAGSWSASAAPAYGFTPAMCLRSGNSTRPRFATAHTKWDKNKAN